MHLLISIFFFKQKTAYEMRISDWSSDVCSSDVVVGLSADECAIIAGSVTIIGMHDIEEDHVPGLDHAIGESVRVWTASRTSDRVDALPPLRAHSKYTNVGDGDQFIHPCPGTDCPGHVKKGPLDQNSKRK